MNHKNKYWVALVASIWMSVTVTVLEGLRPMSNQEESLTGKKWALLVAGSSGYENYRHQADICHAYQILKKGGLKDENIIVFMYDDIAYNVQNPRPGVLINHPNGPDVYYGVPKDIYQATNHVTLQGMTLPKQIGPFATLTFSLPNGGLLYGNDFVDALKKKHAAKSYQKMVIYMEACDAGSMFEGLLPNDINIYVTTASNTNENSYAFYCPDLYPAPPPEYNICLGDTYSIAWMEDSSRNDMTKETLKQQYETVRRRTLINNADQYSHVVEYGDMKINNDSLVTYIGADPANVIDDYGSYLNVVPTNVNDNFNVTSTTMTPTKDVGQRDARLIHLMHKLQSASDGSEDKLKAQKELEVEIAHREYVDKSVHMISSILFGEEKGSTIIVDVRASGQPLVDDWDCLKTFMKTYESHCGTLSSYGRKYSRAFANMCNAGISEKQMIAASTQACRERI
ncbi:vacuolar-processing enzyme gamma-isozyme-like [Cicer arietinum]|uniref:Vacuolar-processing enzyme gamma-isozyme-like n=1 Tax=Cicer arietinum TaxID=3827 RepID=A0A3Q7XA11_CICAR|nr:vacuolar-processing enzyme gamma-isozyme-like [Cicer arietinum]